MRLCSPPKTSFLGQCFSYKMFTKLLTGRGSHFIHGNSNFKKHCSNFCNWPPVLFIAVDAFKNEIISKNVLKRLLKQDVIHKLEIDKDEDDKAKEKYIFQRGQPADYFVLILQGRVEVQVGMEEFVFEEGPFSCFGTKCLVMSSSSPNKSRAATQYIPDFSVKAVSSVLYLKISRGVYHAAVQATRLEHLGKYHSGELFTKELGESDTHESTHLLADGPAFQRSFTSLHESGNSRSNVCMETGC